MIRVYEENVVFFSNWAEADHPADRVHIFNIGGRE